MTGAREQSDPHAEWPAWASSAEARAAEEWPWLLPVLEAEAAAATSTAAAEAAAADAAATAAAALVAGHKVKRCDVADLGEERCG